MVKAIVFGCKAKDVVSGFVGIVTSRHEGYTGTVQWGIQPAVQKKAPEVLPDAVSFDENQVVWVGAGETKRVLTGTANSDMPFALGDEVEDLTSGYRGIAVVRSDWMNGCTQVSIQGKGEAHKDPLKRQGFPLQGIKRVGDGLNAATAPAAKERTGGAPQRVARA